MECKNIIKGMVFPLILAVVCIGFAVFVPISAAAEDSTLETTRTIASGSDWTAFVSDFATASAGTVWNITLATNISVDTSITSSAFLGTLDGGGYTVTLKSVSLFDTAGNGGNTPATIKNIKLTGTVESASKVGALVNIANGVTFTDCATSTTVKGSSCTGGLVGNAINCSFSNCSNSGSIEGSGNYIGGLVGEALGGTMSGCTNSAESTQLSGKSAGGLIGYASSGITVTNCTNSAAFSSSGNHVAGIIGYLEDGEVTDCSNTGAITGTSANAYTAGVVAYAATVSASDCSNSAAITGSGSYTAGIVGMITTMGTVTGCNNSGMISGAANAAGIIAQAKGTAITQCSNTGAIGASSASGNAGGVLGIAYSNVSISTCYNIASIEGSSYAGGMVGEILSSDISISNSYNLGDIEASTGAGGIVGIISTSVSSCTLTNVYSAAVMKKGDVYHSELIGSGTITSASAYLVDVLDVGSTSDGATIVTLTELQEIFSGLSSWSATAGLYPVLSYQTADSNSDYLLYTVPAMNIDDYLVKGQYLDYEWSGSTLTSATDIARVLNEQYTGTVATMYVVDGTSNYSHESSTAYCMPIGMQGVQTIAGDTDGCSYAEQAIFYVADEAIYQYTA